MEKLPPEKSETGGESNATQKGAMESFRNLTKGLLKVSREELKEKEEAYKAKSKDND